MLRDGVEVEYRRSDGSIAGDRVQLIDYDDLDNNDWLAVNQFTVIEGQHNRRPDIVVFVNGLPLAVIELKNAANENATIWEAFKQLQTYKQEIPALLTANGTPNRLRYLGFNARIGSQRRPTRSGSRSGGPSRAEGPGHAITWCARHLPVGDKDKNQQGQDAHATVRIRQGAYLPHWTREGGVYAVTFRLADSLPQQVVAAWKGERGEIVRRAKQAGRELTPAENKRLQELFSDRVEKYLDADTVRAGCDGRTSQHSWKTP